jgi:hypothetical protein
MFLIQTGIFLIQTGMFLIQSGRYAELRLKSPQPSLRAKRSNPEKNQCTKLHRAQYIKKFTENL